MPATWRGWPRRRSAALRPRPCGRRQRRPSSLRCPTRRESIPCRGLTNVAGRHFSLCAEPRLSRCLQGQAETAGAGLCESYGAEVKVFVDTAPLMEKPLAAQAGLGWQGKHSNLVSREAGNWFFIGTILTTRSFAIRHGGRGSLRHLPFLPRHLSDAGLSGALPARCAALHFLSHHRAQGPYRPGVPQAHGQPHLWLR